VSLRPPFSAAQAAFGSPAVVTVPGSSPVETVVVWLPAKAVDVTAGGDIRARTMRRVLALPRVDVPQVLRDTVVLSAPPGSTAIAWRAEDIDEDGPDEVRVVVTPDAEPTVEVVREPWLSQSAMGSPVYGQPEIIAARVQDGAMHHRTDDGRIVAAKAVVAFVLSFSGDSLPDIDNRDRITLPSGLAGEPIEVRDARDQSTGRLVARFVWLA